MGWMTRFEPATSGSTDRRSNQLSYIHHKSVLYSIKFALVCANDRQRDYAGVIIFCFYVYAQIFWFFVLVLTSAS